MCEIELISHDLFFFMSLVFIIKMRFICKFKYLKKWENSWKDVYWFICSNGIKAIHGISDGDPLQFLPSTALFGPISTVHSWLILHLTLCHVASQNTWYLCHLSILLHLSPPVFSLKRCTCTSKHYFGTWTGSAGRLETRQPKAGIGPSQDFGWSAIDSAKTWSGLCRLGSFQFF